MACDGLWDVMSHQEAATMCHEAFLSGKCPDDVAKVLVEAALKKRTEDNVTVVIVKIDWNEGQNAAPNPEKPQEQEKEKEKEKEKEEKVLEKEKEKEKEPEKAVEPEKTETPKDASTEIKEQPKDNGAASS